MTEKICPECNGESVVDKDTEDERRCPTCDGSGAAPDDGHGSEEVWNTHPERVMTTEPDRLGPLPLDGAPYRGCSRPFRDPAQFAGHSLRAGFLTLAAKRGANLFKMMDVSSVDTLRGYVRDAEIFKDHAGAALL
jgi:hypothetical protein